MAQQWNNYRWPSNNHQRRKHNRQFCRKPNIWCVAKYINVIVMIGAIKTNRNNDDPIFFKSRIRKFKPPSKTITLTKSDTSGYKISPKTASVSSTENIGPTKKPNNNNTIMDGKPCSPCNPLTKYAKYRNQR